MNGQVYGRQKYQYIKHSIYIHEKILDLHKSKQGNTTNLNNSFSMENEKRAAQVGLEPTTYCLLGRCSTTKLLRQLNGWVESKQYKARAIDLTIDSIVKGLETGLINTFPADSPRCAVDNIVDSFHGCF